jgi:hypothetical protein
MGPVSNFRNDFRLPLEDDHLSKVDGAKAPRRFHPPSLAHGVKDTDLDEVRGWERRGEPDRFVTCGTFLGGYRRSKENRSVSRDFFHERALPWADDWMETGTWSKPSSDWAFEFKGPRAGNDDCWDESPVLVPEPNPLCFGVFSRWRVSCWFGVVTAGLRREMRRDPQVHQSMQRQQLCGKAWCRGQDCAKKPQLRARGSFGIPGATSPRSPIFRVTNISYGS